MSDLPLARHDSMLKRRLPGAHVGRKLSNGLTTGEERRSTPAVDSSNSREAARRSTSNNEQARARGWEVQDRAALMMGYIADRQNSDHTRLIPKESL